MSYERQRNVKDGDEIITRDDPAERCPTKGELGYGIGPDNKAVINTMHRHEGQMVVDARSIEVLEDILTELKKMNMYNQIAHDVDLDGFGE